jgi:hypothetical protein
MGTVYGSICGCLSSPPEPSPGEYKYIWGYDTAWQRWHNAWMAACQQHDEYACQWRQEDAARAI